MKLQDPLLQEDHAATTKESHGHNPRSLIHSNQGGCTKILLTTSTEDPRATELKITSATHVVNRGCPSL